MRRFDSTRWRCSEMADFTFEDDYRADAELIRRFKEVVASLNRTLDKVSAASVEYQKELDDEGY